MRRSRFTKVDKIALTVLAALFIFAVALAMTGILARNDAYNLLIENKLAAPSRELAIDVCEKLNVSEYGAFKAWLAGNVFTCLLIAGSVLALALQYLLRDSRGANKWLALSLIALTIACLVYTRYSSAITQHYVNSCLEFELTPLEYQMQNGAFTGMAGFLNNKTSVFAYSALGCALLALSAIFKLPKRIFK